MRHSILSALMAVLLISSCRPGEPSTYQAADLVRYYSKMLLNQEAVVRHHGNIRDTRPLEWPEWRSGEQVSELDRIMAATRLRDLILGKITGMHDGQPAGALDDSGCLMAVESLTIAMAIDPDESVRFEAYLALEMAKEKIRQLDKDKLKEYVKKTFESAPDDARINVVYLIDAWKLDNALDVLLTAIGDEKHPIGKAAVVAAVAIGEPAINHLKNYSTSFLNGERIKNFSDPEKAAAEGKEKYLLFADADPEQLPSGETVKDQIQEIRDRQKERKWFNVFAVEQRIDEAICLYEQKK